MDDLIYIGLNQKTIEDFKKAMIHEYEMIDLSIFLAYKWSNHHEEYSFVKKNMLMICWKI